MLRHNCESHGGKAHTIPHLQTEGSKKFQVVLKNTHYSINPDDINIEIEKLGHRLQTSGILSNTEPSYTSQGSLKT
jgi:hypothetical protein